MNERMAELMQIRSELLARISVQREQVAEIGARWKPALTMVDQGMAVVRSLRCHPVLVGVVVALLVARRRSVAGLVWGVWRAWKGYRNFSLNSSRKSTRG